jgi:glycosyltransferase involved in cell wall biosynthesis
VPLIFINRYFYPDHSATSQLLSDLAFELASVGETVTVLTSRQSYGDAEARLPAEETTGGVRIVRIWTTRFGRSNLFGRAIDYLTFYVSAALRLFRLTRRGDILIAKTDPPMLSVIAAPIARLKGARLVNWLQDLFPEVAEAVGVGASPLMRGFYGLLRSLRDASLRTASMNVVLGERMAERVAAAGVKATTIIPNWSDGREIRPVARSENVLRKEWGLDGCFVVGYSGNLGRAHEYRTLIDAIALIEETVPAHPDAEPVAWLFIGGGALYERFREEVAARGLTSVVFKPYQPRERLSESLSAADVHLVSLKPELEGLIVPSKFYGVAAVGRPTLFIGDAHGEIAIVVARHDCGLCVGEGQSRALSQAIAALAADPPRREAMGANARRAFETHYDKTIAFQSWRTILRDVEGGKVSSPQDDASAERRNA